MAGAVRRRTAVPVEQRRRDRGRGSRWKRQRGPRRSHHETEVRALLAASRRCRQQCGTSRTVRPLRLQRRRSRRKQAVVLMAVMKRNALPWLVLSMVVLVLDQLTRLWVLRNLPEYTPIPVIEGFWNWRSEEHTSELQSLMRIS